MHRQIAPSEIHRLRYAKNKSLGLSAEEIANNEKVKLATVEDSIARVEAYHALYNLKEMEACQSEIIILNKTVQQAALRRGLTAERVIRDEAGKETAREPDIEVQLKATELTIKLVEALESSRRGGGSQPSVNLNVGVNANSSAIATATAGAQSFENRLREIRKKREEVIGGAVFSPAPEPSEEVEEVTPDWQTIAESEVDEAEEQRAGG